MKMIGMLRWVVFGGMLAALGCASQQPVVPPEPEPLSVMPMPTGPVVGRVTVVNTEHQFVVIDFGEFPVPKVGTTANVFRDDQNVGRVRLTEPGRGRLLTGDVLAGDLKLGDIVRP